MRNVKNEVDFFENRGEESINDRFHHRKVSELQNFVELDRLTAR